MNNNLINATQTIMNSFLLTLNDQIEIFNNDYQKFEFNSDNDFSCPTEQNSIYDVIDKFDNLVSNLYNEIGDDDNMTFVVLQSVKNLQQLVELCFSINYNDEDFETDNVILNYYETTIKTKLIEMYSKLFNNLIINKN